METEGDPERSAKKTAPLEQRSKEPVSLREEIAPTLAGWPWGLLPSNATSTSHPKIHSQSRSSNLSSSPRLKTWSSSADSNLLSDVNDETASHPCCWLIPITVEGIKTLTLLEIEESETISKYITVEHLTSPNTRETPTRRGWWQPSPHLGHTEVKVGVAPGMYKATVVVSTGNESPNFVIGADWYSRLWPVFASKSLHYQGTWNEVYT